MDSAGLSSGLEKYTLEKVREKSSSPKLQVQNTAFMSALSDNTFENIIMQPKLWGRFVEAAVGSHLINFSKQGKFNVFHDVF
ncbi:MAG: hypothetical protein K8R53_07335 [Bacteroidales bacterium]|nr:hypothetical protein [Bacteroidales bacterium]